MRKTFLYQARINKTTQANALGWLELCRNLYNMALDQRIDAFKHFKRLSGIDQKNQLPGLRAAFPEYKQVGSQCLQDVIERLDRAYQAFFRRVKHGEKPGFPRFKSFGRYDSLTLKQAGWKMAGRDLQITNLGRFRLHLSRPVEGDIKTITIRKTATGKWLVAFSCENVTEKAYPEAVASVGIDVGITSFCTDSQGKKIDNPQYYRDSHTLLRRRQRGLARKVKGSNRRRKARLLVARTHEKTANQRRDFLHKVANHYIHNFASIHVEKLNIKGMVKNRHLSKSITDASWGQFLNLLTYKAAEAGRELVVVNPRNTSKICSNCGEVVKKSLAVRTHHCPHCGLVLDRDENAARNILRAGQALQASTSALAGVA